MVLISRSVHMAAPVRLELTTLGLTVRCSTDWAKEQFPGCRLRQPFFLKSGDDLSSRSVSRQVLSARESLTSVFGMGTGGSFLPLSPLWLYIRLSPHTYKFLCVSFFLSSFSGFSPTSVPPTSFRKRFRLLSRRLTTTQQFRFPKSSLSSFSS